MPELPEVETIRAGLAGHVLGRTIERVEVYSARAVRRQSGGADEFAALLTGRVITAAVRRGKFCWLLLEGPDGLPEDYALLAHLGMSGQLLVRTRSAGSHRHLRVLLQMADGSQVWFVDQRTFGYLTVSDLVPTIDGGPGGFAGFLPTPASDERAPTLAAGAGGGSEARVDASLPAPAGSGAAAPHAQRPMVKVPALLPREAAHIGRDLLDPLVAPGTPGRAALNRRLRQGRRDVKRALLDQELVSGVGNIYADEALWRVRLHHRRRTDRLRAPVVEGLLDATTDVMREALVAGGTSFDALYVNVDGGAGYFERALAVYGRAGEPCLRCGGLIMRESFMNRSSYFCRTCQRRPPLT